MAPVYLLPDIPRPYVLGTLFASEAANMCSVESARTACNGGLSCDVSEKYIHNLGMIWYLSFKDLIQKSARAGRA